MEKSAQHNVFRIVSVLFLLWSLGDGSWRMLKTMQSKASMSLRCLGSTCRSVRPAGVELPFCEPDSIFSLWPNYITERNSWTGLDLNTLGRDLSPNCEKSYRICSWRKFVTGQRSLINGQQIHLKFKELMKQLFGSCRPLRVTLCVSCLTLPGIYFAEHK